jgi:hypothetical protein
MVYSAASGSTTTSTALGWVALGLVLLAAIYVPFAARTWWLDRKKSSDDEEIEATARASVAESSYRTFIQPLFGLTIVFAIAAFLGSVSASDSTSTHITAVDLFTDFAGAGALLGGIGTMLAVWVSYLDRRRKEKHDANANIINNVIDHMDRSLNPDDIRALAELTRALNGNQDAQPEKNLEITSPRQSVSKSA